MKEAFKEIKFRSESLSIIEKAEEIITDYRSQGFTLTLRQIYYQFVARDLIPNTEKSYKRLGGIINDGRMAGFIDWDAIEDRTRELKENPSWEDPGEIIKSAANGYAIDKWKEQNYYVEVWIEKDALIGVIEGVCSSNDVPYFSCRGYVSQSEMWRASKRFLTRSKKQKFWEKECRLIHLGDHDPSGIDMTRDIQDRLKDFGADIKVKRIALTRAQIDEYGPPPNPAKVTDSRFKVYQNEHGDESWELDALSPSVLEDLIREEIGYYQDRSKWEKSLRKEKREKGFLETLSNNWQDVKKSLSQIKRKKK